MTGDLLAADASMRNLLFTGSDDDVNAYRQSRESLVASLAKLEKLAAGNADELQRIHRISNLGDRAFDALSDLRQYSAIPGVAPPKPPAESLQIAHAASKAVWAEIGGLRDADSRWLAQALAAQTKPAKPGLTKLAWFIGVGGGLVAIYVFLGTVFRREQILSQQMAQDLAEKTRQWAVENSRMKAGLSESQAATDFEKQVAEVFRGVLNELGDGVIVLNQKGKYLYYNPAVERMFGRDIAVTEPSEWATRYGFAAESPLLRATHGDHLDREEMEIRPPDAQKSACVAVTARPIDGGVFMILHEIPKVEPEPVPFPAPSNLKPLLIRDVLEEAVAMVQDAATQKKIGMRATIGPAWELPVIADHEQLKQDLNRLLAAIVQSSEEGGSLTISCTRTPSDSLGLQFTAATPPLSDWIELPLAGDLPKPAASPDTGRSTMKIVHPA